MKSVNFVDEVEAIPEERAWNIGPKPAAVQNGNSTANFRRTSNTSIEKASESSIELPSPDADSRDAAQSREERVRLARERFQAERQRRLEQLMEAQRQAELYREEQMMLKKKRLEETRAKQLDRRKSVEERRKQLIMEEKARREELQKKLDSLERTYDSRRGFGGSGRGFAFGSCTPRGICEPISKGQPANGPTANKTSKPRRAVAEPSRTVISTPDLRTPRKRRGSSDWEPPARTPRARGHASLMTGSFTTAMGASPVTLSLGQGASPSPVEETAPLQRAVSATNLTKGPPSAKRPPRTLTSPFSNEKLDRTVSTPNISQGNHKMRVKTRFGGASSTPRLAENAKKASSDNNIGRSSPTRLRGSSRKPPALSNYSMTASLYLPSTSSSSFFDRLSQPRRLSTQNEEEPLEARKRLSAKPSNGVVNKSPAKTLRQKPKPKPLPAEKLKESSKQGRESPRTTRESPRSVSEPPKSPKGSPKLARNSPRTVRSSPKPSGQGSPKLSKKKEEKDGFHVIGPSVMVVVEAGEQNQAFDGLEPENVPRIPSPVPEGSPSPSEAAELASSGSPVPPSDRAVTPPRTLALAQTVVDGLKVSDSSPSAHSEPGLAAEDAEKPSRSLAGLRAPSPSLRKGSAPSTPTGQRGMPRTPSHEISEEEYKQRLAEQRRLARERLAAQEAEKMRVIEEERKRREEEARKLREEAERQQHEEDEKRKAEQERLEAEERERKEEEERKKAEEEHEREEEERKRQERLRLTRESLENMEKQREEHQKIEEQHRLERKKRLETIMSRVKKSTDLSGSRESLSSSHLDLTANGAEDDRPLSPAPQFKSALLQSMLSKGRLSNSIRAVSALRRSAGTSGSTGSLLADIRNLSRSSENLASASNSNANIAASAAGDMTTSQTEDQLSPPPVVNPAMWRSHPNGIPGLSGHRPLDDDIVKNDEDMETSISIPVTDSDSISRQEGDFVRQTSVRFEVKLPHEEESWISSSSANREVADLMS